MPTARKPRTTENAEPKKAAEVKREETKPAAAKRPAAKYTDEVKAITKRAQAARGRANAVAPVTVTRVQALLEREGKTAEQVVKSFRDNQGGERLRGRIGQGREGDAARRRARQGA